MTEDFRVIHWKDEWPHDEHHVVEVWVEVAKMDAAWLRADVSYYVEPGAPNPDSRFRYDRFGRFIATTTELIGRAVICPNGDSIVFTNGRHRFAWLRDHGVLYLPVSTGRDNVAAIKAICGTSSRECRMPLPVKSRVS